MIAGWVCANKWEASALSPFFSFSFWGEDIWDLHACQMCINGLWRKSQKSAKFHLYCFRERRFLSVNNVDDSYLQGSSFEECFLNALSTTTVLRSLWSKIYPDKSLFMPKQSTIYRQIPHQSNQQYTDKLPNTYAEPLLAHFNLHLIKLNNSSHNSKRRKKIEENSPYPHN